MITKRSLPRTLTTLVAFAFVMSACSSGGATASPSAAASASASAPASEAASESAAADPMAALADAAKAEGQLTTIALPHDWCNYGEAIDGFKAKYGLEVNELDPKAGSGDEIEAIKANKDNPGPQAPDTIDVGLAFGPSSKTDGILAPYKVSTWDTIPDDAKDADGAWFGEYYGVLSFEVNTEVVKNVPKDWSDLLKPEYKGQVALAGDPRTSSQAIQAVHAAALANGGSLDNAQPGLDFFKQLNDLGNFKPVIATSATIAAGETPISIRWTYNALANRDATAASGGPAIEVVVPTSVRFAGVYVMGISAYCTASERREAVGRVPLLGRGPERLAEGLLRPDPVPGSRCAQRRPGGAARQASRRHGSRLPDDRTARCGQDADHHASGIPVVGANVQ